MRGNACHIYQNKRQIVGKYEFYSTSEFRGITDAVDDSSSNPQLETFNSDDPISAS